MFSTFRVARARPVKLAGALLMSTALGALAVDIGADLAAKASLRRVLAAHPGMSVDTIDAAPFSGRLSLMGIHARTGHAEITIGRLDLPLAQGQWALIARAEASPFDDAPAPASPAPASPAPASPAPVGPPEAPATIPAPTAAGPLPASANTSGTSSAENVVITSGSTTYRIKRIDMTGTSLTSADLTALLDTKSTEAAEARLKKFNAAAVVVPELLADDTAAGHDRHMSMTHILLASVVAGKAAAGSAGEISFALKDDKSTVNGTTGAIEATDIDFRQIAHVFGTVRTDENEPILPLYDAFIVNTIKITNVTQKSTVSIAAFKEIGAKARALKTDFMAAAQSKADPSDAKSAALFDDMAHSFQIGLLQMTDVESRNEAPEGATTFSMGTIAMKTFIDRKIGGLSLSDVHVAGPDMKFDIGTLDVGAFVIPQAKGSAVAGEPAGSVAPPATLDIGQLGVDVISKNPPTDTTPASTTNLKFKLGHAAFASDGRAGEIPTKASLSINDLSFDVPPGDPAAFNAMGYKHVTFTGAMTTAYDADAQTLGINDLSVNGTEMGSLVTTIGLINVGKGLISSDQQIQASSAVAILLKGVDLKITNNGLFEKAIAYKANKDGMTVAQERDLGVDFFENKLPVAMNGNPKVKLVGSAVAKFIADPKTFHLKLDSKAGVGVAAMGMLSSPDLILDMVDVQAGADE